MATKKSTGTKAKRAKAKSAAKRPPKYGCPNSGSKKLSLKKIVRKIMSDQAFARFMRALLCRVHKRDPEAIKCLQSYYQPEPKELSDLCIPESERKSFMFCSENGILLDVIAHVHATKR